MFMTILVRKKKALAKLWIWITCNCSNDTTYVHLYTLNELMLVNLSESHLTNDSDSHTQTHFKSATGSSRFWYLYSLIKLKICSLNSLMKNLFDQHLSLSKNPLFYHRKIPSLQQWYHSDKWGPFFSVKNKAKLCLIFCKNNLSGNAKAVCSIIR